MPDLTELIFDVDEKSCDIRLECKFNNPDYAREITKRLIKQLSKGKKPRSLLLIPNYGFASKKESMIFYRALPQAISAGKIIFLLLPTDGTGEYARHGLKKF